MLEIIHMTNRIPENIDWEWFLLICRTRPGAPRQFDSGRRKLRVERAPVSTDKQFARPLVSSVAVGLTVLSPLIFLSATYLWAWAAR